jgi:tRNA(fMet)-specific endonuclease VapC
MRAAEPTFLLDANICIYILSGTSEAARARVQASPLGSLVTSSVACAEVLIGAGSVGAAARAEALFSLVEVLPFDFSAAEVYARLPFRRGSFDRLIAAHALSLDLTLVSNNERDFADLPDLRVENWIRE